jgi:steroid 5-alpha reductase family enzyme
MGEKSQRILTSIGLLVAVIALAYVVGDGSTQVAGLPTLVFCAALAIGLQWLAFIPAALKQTETFYDIAGSATYLLVVAVALAGSVAASPLTLTAAIPAAMVAIWTVRLGLFLYRRIHRAGLDPRFDAIKTDPSRFFFAWTAQGLWVFLTLFAVLIILTDGGADDKTSTLSPHWSSWVGWCMWVLGFTIEIMADNQKSAFNAQTENKGRWIDSGLWAFSQHPNYFGECLLWAGIFVSGYSVYDGVQWLAVLSPIFVYLLLTRGSGIPLLDARAVEKWGDNPAYEAYRTRTSTLFLWPPKR